MIHELVRSFFPEAPGAGLFSYTSFRAAMAVLTAFALSLWLGHVLIHRFRTVGIGEDTSKTDSDVLAKLHASKKGTPTMGGLFLVGGMLIACLLWMRFDGIHVYSIWGMAVVAWFAGVGLADDWIKLKGSRKGMSKKAKQLLLTAGAVGAGLVLHHFAGLETGKGGPQFYVPFFKDVSWPLAGWFGIPFLLVCVAVLTGAANGVNFTDGLDGLAVGCVVIATLAYALITYVVGHQEFAEYLLISHVQGCNDMTVMMAALLGACLAFLWYNAAPAQVFMGDVGSLALGGALGYVALVSRTELVLLVVGGVFVAEALSVIIQIISFRTTGKRVFRCAPLHHHFQFAGMPETRVVIRTWIVAVLLALTSLSLFKIR